MEATQCILALYAKNLLVCLSCFFFFKLQFVLLSSQGSGRKEHFGCGIV